MPKGDKAKFKADPEDGTTPVANLLLEAVAIANLSGREKGAILYLWRRTYGWTDKLSGKRLKERYITLPEWAKAIHTDITHASEVLTGLAKKNIFNRDFLGPGRGYIYQMNTDIKSWNSASIDLEALQFITTLPEKYKGYATVQGGVPPKSNTSLPPKSKGPSFDFSFLKERLKKDYKERVGTLQQGCAVLVSIKGYPFDLKKDAEHLCDLGDEFPKLDLLKVIKALAAFYLDKPLKKGANPRLRLRHFCEKEVEWLAGKKGKKQAGGQELPDTAALEKSWGKKFDED